jgi:hypothetical protein
MLERISRFAVICALPLALATPVYSGPTVGLGLSFGFGASGVQTGVGVRVFSGNRSKSTVGSVGLDYMLPSQTWRGTVGLGYLHSNKYLGLDLGIGLGSGDFSFGLGIGGANTKPQTQASAQTASQNTPDTPPNDGPQVIIPDFLPTPQ